MRYLLNLILLTLAVLASSCGRGGTSGEPPTLQILSPHGSAIRLEFERAFIRWHKKKYGTDVRVEWPVLGSGGTNEIRKFLSTVYVDGSKPSCGYDVMFGGGSATFNDLIKINALEAPDPSLPAAILAAAAAEVQGNPLRGPSNLWIAATMSNFGIVVNKTRLAELHLTMPKAWKDLAGPEWLGNISLADPSKGSSVKTCFEMLLQQYGWKDGWPLLVRFFANADSVQTAGSNPGEEVGNGNVVAGVLIDFFGRTAIIKQGSDLMAFVVPDGGSSLDSDPVAVLKGAPHKELASHFLEFVVSADGQKLWIQRPGTPGGPESKALGRMSTIADLYRTQAAYLTDPTNPFEGGSPLKPDAKIMALRSSFLGGLIKASLIDNQELLQTARRAVRDAGDPPALLARFDELPFAEAQTAEINTQFADPMARLKMANEWRAHYAALFRSIEAEARRSEPRP
jgi:ABC-type Fe3+ transport system substrate-binding protein